MTNSSKIELPLEYVEEISELDVEIIRLVRDNMSSNPVGIHNSELADELDYSENHVSERVTRLREIGILEKENDERIRPIKIADLSIFK